MDNFSVINQNLGSTEGHNAGIQLLLGGFHKRRVDLNGEGAFIWGSICSQMQKHIRSTLEVLEKPLKLLRST